MWVRAAWLEGKREEEGVIPAVWVKDKTVFWPPGINADKAMVDMREPGENWREFCLIKVKTKSASRRECENYEWTSQDSACSSDDGATKRKRIKKSFPEYVIGGEKTDETEPEKPEGESQKSDKQSQAKSGQHGLPIPPPKLHSAKYPALQLKSTGASPQRSRSRTPPNWCRSSTPLKSPLRRSTTPPRARSQRSRSVYSSRHARSQRSRSIDASRRARSQRSRSVDSTGRARSQRSRSIDSPRRARSQRSRSIDSSRRVRSQRSIDASRHARSQRSRSVDSTGRSRSQRSRSIDSPRRARSQRSRSIDSSRRARSQRSRSIDSPRRAMSHQSRSVDSPQRARSQRSRSIDSPQRAMSLSPVLTVQSLMPHTTHNRSLFQKSTHASPSENQTSSSNKTKHHGPLKAQHKSSGATYSSGADALSKTMNKHKSSSDKTKHHGPLKTKHTSSTYTSGATYSSGADAGSTKCRPKSSTDYPISEAKFQRRVIYLLTEMRNELVQKSGANSVCLSCSTVEATEDLMRRLSTIDEFSALEKKLKNVDDRSRMIQLLSNVGGIDSRDNVRKLMTKLMTNDLMAKFNLKGNKGKIAFEKTALYDVIQASAQKSFPGTEHKKKLEIGSVLKYAPDRRGGGGRQTNGHE